MSIQVRLAAALLGLTGFAALASQARGDSILRGDIRLTRWIQGRDWPLLDHLVDAANASMRTGPLVVAGIVIIGLLAWRRLRVEAALLLSAGVLMHLSNVMKELIESPRPTPDLVRVTEHAATYGFPGGRAGNAVLFLGALAWIADRRLGMGAGRVAVWAAAVVGTLLTGLARVRVGAHWPSDIYGAWLWTLPTLLLLTVAADRLQGSRVLADRGRAKRWSVVESHSNATRSKRLSSRPQGAGATTSGSGCPASDVARPASGPLWLPLRRVPGTTPSRIAMRRYRRVR